MTSIVMPDENGMVEAWRIVLHGHRAEINAAVMGWPEKRSFNIRWADIHRVNPDLAETTLERPIQSISAAEEAIRMLDVPAGPESGVGGDGIPRLHVRITHLPSTSTFAVRELRAEHLGKLVMVRGLVKRSTEVRPMADDALFTCERCGAFLRVPQEEHQKITEPLECYEDQGGCGRESKYKLVLAETRGQQTRMVDTQKVELQEHPDELRGGEQPRRLVCWMYDDMVDEVRPGERVTLVGIFQAHVPKTKSNVLETYIDVVGGGLETNDHEEVEWSEDDVREFREFSERLDVYEVLQQAIAPDLFGLDRVKDALVLQLFGGVEKQGRGSRLRGDIHILLVGDPGVAKSQLVRKAGRLAPRRVFATGKGASAAGLTAAAVKDEFGEGRWTLEAGAMVLADRGLLCVDELDKMGKSDQSSMHEGMEQQSVTIAKAGINATLHTRCAVLGAANPKSGRFDTHTPIPEQLNFPPALLSRFDAVFVMRDVVEQQNDRDLADFILGVHAHGNTQRLETVNVEWLRKYIAYAKARVRPQLSPEASERLRDYYVQMRREGQAGDEPSIPLTARQIEGLVRLSEAHAKVRLSPTVTREDADEAISLTEYWLRSVAGTTDGRWDIDTLATGLPQTIRHAYNVVREVLRGSDDPVEEADLLEQVEARGIDRVKASAALARLKAQQEVYEPRTGHYKLT